MSTLRKLKEKCIKVQKHKTTNRFQIARKELGMKTKLCSCKKFCSEDFENTRGKRVFVLVDSFVDLPGNEKKYNLKKVITLCQLHDKSISWNHYQAVNLLYFQINVQ